jgi:LytS/YehU family sensor histidine kinase
LRVDITVDPDVSEVPVPYLLLQPLVENAVRHGVAPHSEAGVVRVTASRLPRAKQSDQVELTVADSGPGFPDTDVDVLSDDDDVGLSNTKRRLETLYGDEHTFDLGTAAEGGARITIRLPVDPEARTVEADDLSTAVPTPEQ